MGALAGLASIVALFANNKSKQKVKEIKKDIRASKKKVETLKSGKDAMKETQKNYKKTLSEMKEQKETYKAPDVGADEAADFLKKYAKKKK